MANVQQQIAAPDAGSASDQLATIDVPQVPNASEIINQQQQQQLAELLESVNMDSLLETLTQPTSRNPDGTMKSNNWLVDESSKDYSRPDYNNAGNRNKGQGTDGRTNNYNKNASADTSMPSMMQSITGEQTWGGLAETATKQALVGLAGMKSPVMGSVLSSAMNAAEDGEISGMEAINMAEDAVLGFTGISLMSNMLEAAAELAGVYSTEDGIINSIMDVLNGDEEINTVAGFYAAGGLEGQQNRIRAAIAQAGGDINAGSDFSNYGMGHAGFSQSGFGSDRSGSDASTGGLGSGSYGDGGFGSVGKGTGADDGGLGSGAFGGANFGGSPTGNGGNSGGSDGGNGGRGEGNRAGAGDGTGQAKNSVGANF